MSTVLVCGATGTVGSRVVHELRARGAATRVFVRDREKALTLLPGDIDLAIGDFADPHSIRAALDGVDRVFLGVPTIRGRWSTKATCSTWPSPPAGDGWSSSRRRERRSARRWSSGIGMAGSSSGCASPGCPRCCCKLAAQPPPPGRGLSPARHRPRRRAACQLVHGVHLDLGERGRHRAQRVHQLPGHHRRDPGRPLRDQELVGEHRARQPRRSASTLPSRGPSSGDQRGEEQASNTASARSTCGSTAGRGRYRHPVRSRRQPHLRLRC